MGRYRGKECASEIVAMKKVERALGAACAAGFMFGVMNGCGTDPISHRGKPLSASSDDAGDPSTETAGTTVVDPGTSSTGTSATGAGGSPGGSPGAGGANTGASGTDATGVGGSTGGVSGGGMSGAGGSSAGASGAGGEGGSSGGAAGAGGSSGGAGGAGGAGGSTPTGCNNATVVDAAGSTTKCPAKTMWTATAMPTPPHNFMGIADNKLQPQYAIDGNTATRYSTGAKSAGGEWFRVDLGATTQVTGIVLDDTVDFNDVPYGYKVEVSTDGTAWTQVATCNAIASTTETINFAAKPARYVRVTDTTAGIHWWSIDEISVLCK
jgi:hypothetical protein